MDTNKYKIRDLGVGYGAFVKLSKQLILKDNFLLNMGESYIVANIMRGNDDIVGMTSKGGSVTPKLRLKIFSV